MNKLAGTRTRDLSEYGYDADALTTELQALLSCSTLARVVRVQSLASIQRVRLAMSSRSRERSPRLLRAGPRDPDDGSCVTYVALMTHPSPVVPEGAAGSACRNAKYRSRGIAFDLSRLLEIAAACSLLVDARDAHCLTLVPGEPQHRPSPPEKLARRCVLLGCLG